VVENDFYKIEVLDYPVYLGNHLWNDLSSFLQQITPSREVFLLSDHNTHKNCLPVLIEHLPWLAERPVFSIKPGEDEKEIATLTKIWIWLMELRASKRAILVNLGGGVVTDLGGFAAATFKRGISYVNIPTSLIGQVDAAIGGKTGVNVSGVKNQAGAFNDPEAVFIMPAFLATLPEDHFKSGMAEIIKCAILSGNEFWEKTVNMVFHSQDFLFELIRESVLFKCKVVLDDPLEQSSRKMLNFGHTIGHGLESFFNRQGRNDYSHGEAVATGMICEAYISYEIASLPSDELEGLSRLIIKVFDLKPMNESLYDMVWQMMEYDKKNTEIGIGFSLIEKKGKPILARTANKEFVYRAFEYFNRMVEQ